MARTYVDKITNKKYKGVGDEEAMKHEYHCYVNIIPKGQRTLYSCNCSEKEAYRKRFTPGI